MSYYSKYCATIASTLDALLVSTLSDHRLDHEEAFSRLCEWTSGLQSTGGWLYLCGNGASATMASHMALDWLKNGGVKAAAFNDSASLTAFGNDESYERVFAGPLQKIAGPTDLLVTISSSGNSPNVIAAIAAARANGSRVVTFSGFKEDNASRRLGDLNFFVPCQTYGQAECCHQILLHAWLDKSIGLPA